MIRQQIMSFGDGAQLLVKRFTLGTRTRQLDRPRKLWETFRASRVHGTLLERIRGENLVYEKVYENESWRGNWKSVRNSINGGLPTASGPINFSLGRIFRGVWKVNLRAAQILIYSQPPLSRRRFLSPLISDSLSIFDSPGEFSWRKNPVTDSPGKRA